MYIVCLRGAVARHICYSHALRGGYPNQVIAQMHSPMHLWPGGRSLRPLAKLVFGFDAGPEQVPPCKSCYRQEVRGACPNRAFHPMETRCAGDSRVLVLSCSPTCGSQSHMLVNKDVPFRPAGAVRGWQSNWARVPDKGQLRRRPHGT
jgi:hypothetical protein